MTKVGYGPSTNAAFAPSTKIAAIDLTAAVSPLQLMLRGPQMAFLAIVAGKRVGRHQSNLRRDWSSPTLHGA